MAKKGFTLVELSIVLVIIGLLIGGILVAQSMISASKLTAQVRQFQQFDIAVNLFKQKFGGLPGDTTKIDLSIGINDTGVAGNNDGVLGGAAPCCTTNTYLHDQAEFTNFWFQLETYTQILQDGHSYKIMQSRVLPGVNVPTGVMSTNNNIGIVVYGVPSTGLNYYDMADQNSGSSGYYKATVSMTPADSLSLDEKIDDGNGITGVLVERINNTSNYDASVSTNTNCISAAGVYNTSYKAVSCLPRLEMFSQTGGAY